MKYKIIILSQFKTHRIENCFKRFVYKNDYFSCFTIVYKRVDIIVVVYTFVNLLIYSTIASNEPRIIPLNRSPICNATNYPPMNYGTVYSKFCEKIKNRITPEARFLLFLHRSIHDRSVSMQDLQGGQAFPQT